MQVWVEHFLLLGNFVEIVLVSKNAPRGSHCGRAENLAIAIRRRRRMLQATFFIIMYGECVTKYCKEILFETLNLKY